MSDNLARASSAREYRFNMGLAVLIRCARLDELQERQHMNRLLDGLVKEGLIRVVGQIGSLRLRRS